MKRIQLTNIVAANVQGLIESKCQSKFVAIHLIRPQFVFCFDFCLHDEEFLFYDWDCCNVINESNNREYPNLSKYLAQTVFDILYAAGKENQKEYFNSLTGAGLRQIRQENDN